MHHLAAEIKLCSQAWLLLSLFYEASEGRLVPLQLFNNSGVLRVQMTTELFGSPPIQGCCRPFYFSQGGSLINSWRTFILKRYILLDMFVFFSVDLPNIRLPKANITFNIITILLWWFRTKTGTIQDQNSYSLFLAVTDIWQNVCVCVTVSLHSLQQQVSRLVLAWPGPFRPIALRPLLWVHPPHDCPSALQPPLRRPVLVEKVSEHHQLYAG